MIQEQCPHCKEVFDSLIEFDYNNKNHNNKESGFNEKKGQKNTQSFGNLLGGSFSLGKLMQIISLIGDASDKIGDQSVSLIIEQCKLMGLKKEDENIIYRIVEMVGNQDVSVRDVLITIYRFAKVLGISDDVADMYYYKLMINSNNSPPISNKTDAENIKEILWEGN